MNERWQLAAGYTPEPWVLVLLGVVTLVAVAESVATLRRPHGSTPRRAAWATFGLRLLAIAALLALAFELTLRVEQVAETGGRVVVLVDRSASMAIPDAVGEGTPETRQSRAEAIWSASKAARERWVEDGLVVDVRGFDVETTPYAADVAATLHVTPDGPGSDLGRAFAELAETQFEGGGGRARTPLVGVVVVSDGLVAHDGATDRHVRGSAEALGVPITTVSVGAPKLHDVSVAEVRAGEFAFVENVTEIDATIIAHGAAGQPSLAVLRRDGVVVHEQPITLEADGVPLEVHFEVAPDRVGQFVYEVVVDARPGEATTENNDRAFVVKVLRDKVRVLHVAGRPDWDVRALRTLLRRDPNVELLSYYILRGFDDIEREDTTAPLSLIPFPTDDLFEEELGSFDLVILHNFDAVQHSVGRYVDNMAEYVVQGGALVLIGGDLAFSDSGYATQAMSALLPIDTHPPIGIMHERIRPALTEAGQRHPITAWLGSEGWDALPELDTWNPMQMNARADAIAAAALLVHPTQKDARGEPRPLLAVSEPGRGRAMVLATGSTWRLGFAPDLPLIEGARPYDLLWLGAVRWLLRDDSSGRLQLETGKPRYRTGEAIELQVTTLSASYAREPEVEVEWEIVALGQDGGEPAVRGRFSTDALGRARATVEALPVGAYAAVARRELEGAHDDPEDVGLGQHEARRVFIVESPGRELARIDADPGIERLRELAKATGGVVVSAIAGDRLPQRLPVRVASAEAGRVDGRSDRPLWNGWIAMVVLVISFGGEWILRRRYAAA